MKRKILFFTIILTCVALSGCSRKNSQGTPDTTPNTSTPSSATDTTAQNTTQHTGESRNTISEEEAKQIALSHAGLTADQVVFVKCNLDTDSGRTNYDVEFYTNDEKTYDYDIDAYTGEVLDFDYDAEYHTESAGNATGENISADRAKEIALAKVPGATAEDIREFKSETDNHRLEYQGKIHYNGKEYEFEIDGMSGDILEWDVEAISGNTR